MERLSCWRLALAIILPPLAVADRGCGAVLLVAVLTLLGWVPGTLAAVALLMLDEPRSSVRQVTIPRVETDEPAKRKGAFLRLSDGDVAQVLEDDGAPLDWPPIKRKRGEPPQRQL